MRRAGAAGPAALALDALKTRIKRQNQIAAGLRLAMDGCRDDFSATVELLGSFAVGPPQQPIVLLFDAGMGSKAILFAVALSPRLTYQAVRCGARLGVRINAPTAIDDFHARIQLRMPFDFGHGVERKALDDHLLREFLGDGDWSGRVVERVEDGAEGGEDLVLD